MGPNSNDLEVMRKLVQGGMDIARFNFSHGTHEEQKERMDALKKMKNNKELSEDEHATCEKEVDKVISDAITKIDKLCADKEKDVLSV